MTTELGIEWNVGALRAGAIVNVRGISRRGRMIRTALGGSWSNHDALLIPYRGRWWIGDAEPPAARLTPIEEYAAAWERGLRFRILWPEGATEEQGHAAADWWIANVRNAVYDYWGAAAGLNTVRIALKALTVLTGIPWPEQWHWAWYCTESVAGAWQHGAGLDLWRKRNPTPRTTEKRLAAGILRDITAEAVSAPIIQPPTPPKTLADSLAVHQHNSFCTTLPHAPKNHQ